VGRDAVYFRWHGPNLHASSLKKDKANYLKKFVHITFRYSSLIISADNYFETLVPIYEAYSESKYRFAVKKIW